MPKNVGVLGGYGPYATSLFFETLINDTPAEKDGDHLRVIIENNPRIPSRARAYLFNEESPLPYMIAGIENLKKCGAEFFVCPCNSAHYFLRDAELPLPMLDMISLTVARQSREGYKKSLLLGSEITLRSGMYEKDASGYGVEVVPYENESEVRFIIEAGKTKRNLTEAQHILQKIVSHSERKGFSCVIFGCTELALVINPNRIEFPILDTINILSQETVKYAYC